MSLVVYAGPETEASQKLAEAVTRAAAESPVEVLSTFDNLRLRLHGTKADLEVAVLLIASLEELERLHSIRSVLDDVRLILILPAMDPRMMLMARGLYPRFLTCSTEGFPDVEAVVRKMLTCVSRPSRASEPSRRSPSWRYVSKPGEGSDMARQEHANGANTK